MLAFRPLASATAEVDTPACRQARSRFGRLDWGLIARLATWHRDSSLSPRPAAGRFSLSRRPRFHHSRRSALPLASRAGMPGPPGGAADHRTSHPSPRPCGPNDSQRNTPPEHKPPPARPHHRHHRTPRSAVPRARFWHHFASLRAQLSCTSHALQTHRSDQRRLAFLRNARASESLEQPSSGSLRVTPVAAIVPIRTPRRARATHIQLETASAAHPHFASVFDSNRPSILPRIHDPLAVAPSRPASPGSTTKPSVSIPIHSRHLGTQGPGGPRTSGRSNRTFPARFDSVSPSILPNLVDPPAHDLSSFGIPSASHLRPTPAKPCHPETTQTRWAAKTFARGSS